MQAKTAETVGRSAVLDGRDFGTIVDAQNIPKAVVGRGRSTGVRGEAALRRQRDRDDADRRARPGDVPVSGVPGHDRPRRGGACTASTSTGATRGQRRRTRGTPRRTGSQGTRASRV